MRSVIDVVLPCLDEAAALPWVLDRMPAGYRAVVADNGSTDGSADVARAHGAEVVAVPQRGFGLHFVREKHGTFFSDDINQLV